MGLPSMSSTRRTTDAGAMLVAMLWLVPETAARVANSGLEPKAWKVTQTLVPVTQALAIAVWPSASGPTVRVVLATPAALVMAADGGAAIPEAFCQATCRPGAGWPAVNTR